MINCDDEVLIVKDNNNEQWDKIISSKHKLFDLKLKEVWDYRDLILLFVKRDFVIYYKQTILGPLWYLIQPIMSTIMYMFVFGTLAKIGTDGIPQPLFYFAGTMLWTCFSGNLTFASNVFADNKGIFGKVYFPRLTVPIAGSFMQMIKLAIQFVLFVAVYIFYFFGQGHIEGVHLQLYWTMLLIPVVVLWLAALSSGIGMIISAITTKYRDIAMMLGFIMSLVMYATPVVYPLSQVSGKLQWLLYLNPVSAPIEMFRVWTFGAGHVPMNVAYLSIAETVLCLFFGLILFTRNERTFVDVI